MANPFDVIMSADIFKNKPLGSGTTHSVYPHPTSPEHVVRMPSMYAARSDLWEKAKLTPVDLPKNLKGRFGLPIAESAGGIQVSPKVSGTSLGYMGDMTPREYVHQVNTLRKMPQEAYTKMRRDMRTVTNSGGFLDSHVGNVKVDGDRFRILDVGEPDDFKGTKYDKSLWKELPSRTKDIDMVNQITGLGSVNDVQSAMPEMSKKRQSIVRRGLNNIFGKLAVAGKMIPALAIPDMLRTGGRIHNVVTGKTSPMEEYADMIGVQTYNPVRDWL